MNTNIAERIVIAADFKPDSEGRKGAAKVVALAQEFKDTGVIIKVNSILRAVGYDLIEELHQLGVKVVADLKLIDIPETMQTDGLLLAEAHPDFVTVMACAEIDGMTLLREALPNTEVWAVTVLTSLDEDLCQQVFASSVKAAVIRLARMAKLAGVGGLVLSPKELEAVRGRRELKGLTLNTPGIRYPWSETGDQKRFRTAGESVKDGVTRVIVGRPILGAKPNSEGRPQSRLDAFKLIVEDIEQALASVAA